MTCPYQASSLCEVIDSLAELNLMIWSISQIIEICIRNIINWPCLVRPNGKLPDMSWGPAIFAKTASHYCEVNHYVVYIRSMIWLFIRSVECYLELKIVPSDENIALLILQTAISLIKVAKILKCLLDKMTWPMPMVATRLWCWT